MPVTDVTKNSFPKADSIGSRKIAGTLIRPF